MGRRENLQNIKDRIEKAAKRAGRSYNDIQLLAVSKVFPVEDIKAVYDLGMRFFGESRAQELRDKVPLLPADIHWHFIGPLQTNKIKYVIANAELIHAVDSFKLARAVADYGERKQIKPAVLVEVNSSGEKEKHGFTTDKAVEAVLEINELKNLEVKGLMTMAANTDDIKMIRQSFSSLKKLYEAIYSQIRRDSFCELSMGMSGDFEIAVEEGSTIVRVGTGIFGPRRR